LQKANTFWASNAVVSLKTV